MLDPIKTPLAALVEPLAELEYYADHQPAGEDSIYEKLSVTLNVEEEHPEREYSLEIFFINDVTEAFGDDDEEDDAVITQLMLVLPFRISTEAYLDVMRYSQLVNRLIPVGAFGLSEDDGAVYLRHCLATESRAIPRDILIEVVTALEYACREYAPQFETISSRRKTYDDIVREFEVAGRALPSVGDPELFIAG